MITTSTAVALPNVETSLQVEENLSMPAMPRPVLLETGALHNADLRGADLRNVFVKRADGTTEKLEDILIRRDIEKYRELFDRCTFHDDKTIFSESPETHTLIKEFLESCRIPNQPDVPARSFAEAVDQFKVEGQEFDTLLESLLKGDAKPKEQVDIDEDRRSRQLLEEDHKFKEYYAAPKKGVVEGESEENR